MTAYHMWHKLLKLRFFQRASRAVVLSTVVLWLAMSLGAGLSEAASSSTGSTSNTNGMTPAGMMKRYVTQAERDAAADRLGKQRAAVESLGLATVKAAQVMDLTATPDYFGVANWANSPLPTLQQSVVVVNLRSRPGTLIKGSGPAVYVTDYVGGAYQKRWIDSPSTFAQFGFQWGDIYYVSDAELASYTDRATITQTDTTRSNGSLLRASSSLPVYLLEEGKKRWVTSPVSFVSNGFRWDRIQVVSQTEINQYPDVTAAGPSTTVTPGTGMRKFVDSLPGLGAANANNLGQYTPVAVPDTTTYPGSDYYEIELVQYTEKMHSDLPPTTLRGYRQTNMDGTPFHYLGPTIVAQKGRPVRVKFTNSLPTGAGGDLFIPVDTTVMGSGMAPNGTEMYTQNRATLHLHGGFVPWISDGTPHQWTTPALEPTSYPKGVSAQNVPDMADPGDGSLTFYYNNQQSARLQFYHDHSYGITRLNVYAGEAAPYIVRDTVEQNLISTGVIPADEIPLVIQDKTFVPDNGEPGGQLARTDPTWDIAKWGGKGSLWYPHVYMPNQNPADPGGMNAFGRWHYGPWFWPPTTNITNGPVLNPYYDPVNAPWENYYMPGTPTPSMAMEAFMDTPVVNGTAYPTLTVDPKAYRFRILNAADDRFFNLQLYKADPAVTTLDGRTNAEVKMVPTAPTAGFPATWPVDGREGGVPDPATAGPSWIQIGNEGGFLPAPAVIANQPVDWNRDPTAFNFGNVTSHSLLVGTAERADVIVDFSQYAGQTLILYNDSPAPFPALDPRYDYYTGDLDLTATGGAPTTLAGFGPNTRTIMQIKVNAGTPAPFDLSRLQATWAATGLGVFASSQDPVLIPTADYNSAYPGGNFAVDPYARIFDTSKTFKTVSGATVTVPFKPKAIQDEMGEAYDQYGRQSGFLGLQRSATVGPGAQNFILYPYASPPVDVVVDNVTPGEPVAGDGTQIWKITHNGVDTHTIHFHMFNVQLLNRVAWDNRVSPPDPNELGWKETIRVNPLEDTIVALRPFAPTQPFAVPNNVRLIDPTMPEGATLMGGPGGFFDPNSDPITVTNQMVNFGWEYVWHCHILAHEEMDMMHNLVFAVGPQTAAPSGLTTAAGVNLTWTDNSPNETGFTIQWATASTGPWSNLTTAVPANPGTGGMVTYTDTSVFTGTRYYRVAANGVDTVAGVPGFNYAFSNVASYTAP